MADDNSQKVGRRAAIKTMSAAGAALTVGTTTSAAMGGEDDGEIDYSGHELPYPNTSVTKLHQSIRNVTNHPEILTLTDADIDRHFENSDLEGRAYTEARDYVRSLRKRYPVQTVSNKNVTMYKLGPRAEKSSITPKKDGNGRAYAKALSVFAGNPDEARANWSKDHHIDITEELLSDTIGSNFTISINSDDPDEFGGRAADRVDDLTSQLQTDNIVEELIVGEVADWLKTVLNVYHTNWIQYYDPSIASLDMGDLGTLDLPYGLGKAHKAGGAFFQEARNESSDYDAEVKCGYSIHYLQDCAQPLHTSMGAEQAGVDIYGLTSDNDIDYSFSKKKWLHYGFEGLVKRNWTEYPDFASDDLKYHMSSSGSPSRIYSAEQAIEDMAKNSTDYGYDIYDTIIRNEDSGSNSTGWDTSTKREVYEDLANCFSTLGYLGHGFMEEFQRER